MEIHFTSVTGRRERNEDRHTIVLNINEMSKELSALNLFGIYDGHGGTKVSEYLEEHIPTFYCQKHLTPPFSKEYHYKIFEQIQKNLLESKIGYSMGSTCLLNIMYKYNNEIHMNIVNLGDSRLTIVYKNGKSNQITTDHKPDEENEMERIEQMGGEVYKDTENVYRIGDLSLSRAFGDGDNAPYISQKPDIYYKKITELTKYIVMGCDGLWDVVNNDELFNLIEKFKKENYSENLASNLATECLKRNCSDNISIIIIEIV